MAATETAPPIEQPTVLNEKDGVKPVDVLKASSSEAPSVSNEQSTGGVTAVAGSQANEPLKKPLPHPLPQSKPQTQPSLTPDQNQKYDELLKEVSSWTEVPVTSAKNAAKEPLTDSERLFLTRDCLLRYLRASKWTTASAAATRLLQTLTWRREYGLHTFTPDYISPEQETGKQVIFGYDNEGRPCLYLNPSKQNTARTDRQLHALVFMLERCVDLMPPGQETVALLINFNDTKQGQGASVSQGTQTLKILQNHYPERLGRALISELPWYINMFFKAISPFIDPVTRTKMKFNEPLIQHVPKEQLIKESGGDVWFEYDHSVYWPSMNGLAEERRNEMQERWEAAGKKVGESELYLRGATGAVSAFAEKEEAAPTDSSSLADKLEETKITT